MYYNDIIKRIIITQKYIIIFLTRRNVNLISIKCQLNYKSTKIDAFGQKNRNNKRRTNTVRNTCIHVVQITFPSNLVIYA